jgi:hypothetical protein
MTKYKKVKCRAGEEETIVLNFELPYTDNGLSYKTPELKYPDEDHQLYTNPVPSYKG